MVVNTRDLLSKDGEKLDIKINPDGTGQLHVPGLRVMEVKSFQHIKKVSPRVSSVKIMLTMQKKKIVSNHLLFFADFGHSSKEQDYIWNADEPA